MTQLCELARSTWQSWVRERLFEVPSDGVFQLTDCLEIMIVDVVREHFSLPETKNVWSALRRSGTATQLVAAADSLGEGDRFDLVIDPAFGEIQLASDGDSLARAIFTEDRARQVNVVPLAPRIRRIKAGFEQTASGGEVPLVRPGRPRRTPASVIELRPRR